MATTLQTLGGRWLAIDVAGRLSGVGRVAPRLLVPMTFEFTDAQQLRLDHVVVRLTAAGELVGTGQLVGSVLFQGRGSGPFAMVEMPTTHRLLDLITDTLGNQSETALTVQPYGLVSWRIDQAAPWEQDTLPDQGAGHPFGVARSEWFASVLGPVRQSDFVYLEVAVPPGQLGDPWRAALDLLRQAEAAWATGDDDAAFSRLRGALDALPGAKQHIFDAVTEEVKRSRIDALTKAYGEFLHLGRHVGPPNSPSAGRFPVTHSDAGFAIALMKTLLSYASRLAASTES